MRANAEYVSGFATTVDQTLSGTWAYNDQSYLDLSAPTTIQIENNDMWITGFDITFNNNAKRVGHDSNGDCETYSLPLYTISGNIKVIWTTNVNQILTWYTGGTTKELDIEIGSSGNDGHFQILIPEFDLDQPAKEFPEEGDLVNIPFHAIHDGTNPICTVTLSDAVDKAW